MRNVFLLISLALLAMMGACKEDEGGGGGAEPVMPTLEPSDLTNQQTSFIRLLCTCQMGGGAVVAADSACVNDYIGTMSVRSCREQVLDDNWGRLWLIGECQQQAYEAAQACLQGDEGCGGTGVCLFSLQNELDRCGPAVQDATSAC